MNGAPLSTLEELQRWFFENCDGDWEHLYGIEITTMDNPGWDVKIQLSDSILCNLQINEEYEGPKSPFELLPDNSYDASYDWYKIWVEDETYRAYCAPKRLGFVLERFLERMREAEKRHGGIYPKE